MPRKKLTMKQVQKEAEQSFRTFAEVPVGLPENLDEQDFGKAMDAILRAYLLGYVAGFALANG